MTVLKVNIDKRVNVLPSKIERLKMIKCKNRKYKMYVVMLSVMFLP